MGLATLSGDTDLQLVDKILDGDRSALDRLYIRTRDRLLTLLFHLCGNAHNAEDLLHEVFVKLWERRRRISIDAAPMAYLFTMARNLWRTQQRRHRIFRRVMGSSLPRNPPALTESRSAESDHRRFIEQAIHGLHPDPREVFTLHRYGELTYAQISRMLGISIKTVEARMKRAFDELRSALKPHLDQGVL